MKSTLLALSLTAILAGCGATKEVYSGPDQVVAPVTMNSIVFTDHSLNRTVTKPILWMDFFTKDVRVTVQKSGVRPSPSGSAEVWVMLKNHTSHPIQIEGRVQFFDKTEAPSEPMSTWQRVYVPEFATVVYKEYATSLGSAYYQVEFREGK